MEITLKKGYFLDKKAAHLAFQAAGFRLCMRKDRPGVYFVWLRDDAAKLYDTPIAVDRAVHVAILLGLRRKDKPTQSLVGHVKLNIRSDGTTEDS